MADEKVDEKTSVEFTWEELAYLGAALNKTYKDAARIGVDDSDLALLERLFHRVIAAGHAMKVPDDASRLISQARERLKEMK